VKKPLAFYLFYATGWTQCTLYYRVRDTQQLEEGPIPEWQSMPMDDAPSRSEPNGNNSRWKQAFVPAPSKSYAMEFYVQGPAPGEGVTGSASDGEGSGRSSRSQNGQVTRGSSSTRDSSGPKEDRPRKGSPDAVYTMPWPGGWKLQNGTVTKFMRALDPPMLLCSDIDGTMVSDSGDKEEKFWGLSRTQEFQNYWENVAALTGGVLVYNTGRSKGQLVHLLGEKEMLAVPDVCITAVGTKIWYLPEGKRAFSDPKVVEWIEDLRWSAELDEDWHLTKVRDAANDVMNKVNKGSHQARVSWLDKGSEHPHRIALSCQVEVLKDVTSSLSEAITSRGLQARIITSGSGDWRYVDAVSRKAGKLEALEWVREMYNVPLKRCATAGDSCNDILMLDGKMPAIIVGNAQPELVTWYHQQNDEGRIVLAHKPDAGGVLEGLARHNLM